MYWFGYWVPYFGSAFGVINRVGATPIQAKRIKLDLGTRWINYHKLFTHTQNLAYTILDT